MLTFGAAAMDGHTGERQTIPPGWGLLTTEGTNTAEIRSCMPGELSTYFLVSHSGDPANDGITIRYDLLLDGASIAHVTLDAAANDRAIFITAPHAVDIGTQIQVIATLSAPLRAFVTTIAASCS